MTNKKTEVFADTGEVIERDMTEIEIAEFEAVVAAEAQILLEKQEKATAKTALLARLGLTDDEAKLLLS
jgi:hypothetical protein